MYRAADVMSKQVVSIPLDATIEESVRTLLEHEISGAPVIDDNGNLVGIISEFQLMQLIYEPQMRTAPVSRFMTRDVHTVTEGTWLSDVVGAMVSQRIRRVPVVRGERLVGLISRPDVLRYALEAGAELQEFVTATHSSV